MKKLIFFALTMCMCHSAYNQIYLHPLTDDELSSKGLKLYNDKKYIEAAPYLYAYYQNNYKAIKQSRSVTIEECLRFIEEDMKNANQERQSLPELKRELEKLRKRDDPSIGSSGDPLKHSAPKLILLTPNQEVKYNQHLEQVATETMPNEMTKKAKSRAGVTKADIETTPSTSSGGHGRNSEAKVCQRHYESVFCLLSSCSDVVKQYIKTIYEDYDRQQ